MLRTALLLTVSVLAVLVASMTNGHAVCAQSEAAAVGHRVVNESVVPFSSWTTVSEISTTVDSTNTGLFLLNAQGFLVNGSSTAGEANYRFLVDGVGGDWYSQSLDSGCWGVLAGSQQITLSPGTHVIGLQASSNRPSGMTLRPNSFIELTAINSITVPEPGSITLLVFGAVGLLAYGWRRRKTT